METEMETALKMLQDLETFKQIYGDTFPYIADSINEAVAKIEEEIKTNAENEDSEYETLIVLDYNEDVVHQFIIKSDLYDIEEFLEENDLNPNYCKWIASPNLEFIIHENEFMHEMLVKIIEEDNNIDEEEVFCPFCRIQELEDYILELENKLVNKK